MHHRDPLDQGGVVHQVPGREVVGAVDDHVVAVDDVEDVVGPEPHVVGDDVDVGVEQGQRLLGRVDLALADPVHVVQDLALQVRRVDHVHVDDPERPHPRRGQVERGRGAEAARPEQQDLGVEQLQLARLAHLGQEQVALVAVALVGGEGARRRPRPAVVLPAVEAAGHRGHVGVAELAQRLGRERRADARRRSRRRPGPPCRAAGPRPRTRAGPGGCARPRRWRPARTRRARGRRGTVAPPRRDSASAVSTSSTTCLAWLSSSLGVGMDDLRPCGIGAPRLAGPLLI